MKNIENDKKLANLRILRPMRIKGVHYDVNDVATKADFASTGDWMDLAALDDPWLEQTNDKAFRARDAAKGKRGKSAAELPAM
jgi:hypothetical protein